MMTGNLKWTWEYLTPEEFIGEHPLPSRRRK